MKQIKYLASLLVALLAAACSSDPTDNSLALHREALLESREVGIYQKGEQVVRFEKQSQQLFVDASHYRFRIQNDAGNRYAEITLSGMPLATRLVTATVGGNLLAETTSYEEVQLLNQADGLMWLWSDKGHWGCILPWPQL